MAVRGNQLLVNFGMLNGFFRKAGIKFFLSPKQMLEANRRCPYVWSQNISQDLTILQRVSAPGNGNTEGKLLEDKNVEPARQKICELIFGIEPESVQNDFFYPYLWLSCALFATQQVSQRDLEAIEFVISWTQNSSFFKCPEQLSVRNIAAAIHFYLSQS